jgi:mannose-6-phosphate isomerase class I
VPAPRVVRHGDGWAEERLGSLPEMFFAVHRIVLDADEPAPDHTAGKFNVLTVVEGDGVLVTAESGYRHLLRYAETLVVPASVGRYTLTRHGAGRTRLVKSFVA